MESCRWRMVIEVYDFTGNAERAQAGIVKHRGWEHVSPPQTEDNTHPS